MQRSPWTVITVTYNSGDDLRRFWAPPAGAFRWIVVDNASQDDSVSVATGLGAEVLVLERNRGFAVANNRALREVDSELVAFANPDVTLDPASLPVLADDIRASGSLVAPLLAGADGTQQPGARGLPFLVDKLAHRGVRLPGADLDGYVPRVPDGTPTYAAWVMGAAVAGRTDTVRALGGWDERYFIYYEDHELGLTAWRRGVGVIVDPRVQWVHGWRRATSGLSLRHWRHEVASGARFYRRHPELLVGPRSRARRVHDAASRRSGHAWPEGGST